MALNIHDVIAKLMSSTFYRYFFFVVVKAVVILRKTSSFYLYYFKDKIQVDASLAKVVSVS